MSEGRSVGLRVRGLGEGERGEGRSEPNDVETQLLFCCLAYLLVVVNLTFDIQIKRELWNPKTNNVAATSILPRGVVCR